MKTLFKECKTSNIDIDRLFKSTILYDDNDIESVISSLSEETVSIWLLSEILSRKKEFHWQTLKKTQFSEFRSKYSVWHNITKQNIFRRHYKDYLWSSIIKDSCIDLFTDEERCK